MSNHPNLSKEPVKAALLPLLEHYAGSPRSRKILKSAAERVQFSCPRCAGPTLTATLYPAGDKKRSDQAGCSNKECGVPRSMDAPDLIACFEGYEAPNRFPKAIARGYEILGLAPDGQPLQPQDEKPPGAEAATPASVPPSPPDGPAPAPSKDAPGEQARETAGRKEPVGDLPVPPGQPGVFSDAGPGDQAVPGRAATPHPRPPRIGSLPAHSPGDPEDGDAAAHAAAPTTGSKENETTPTHDEAVPVADLQAPTPPAAVDRGPELDRRDRVYRSLLGLCVQDKTLLDFFAYLEVDGAIIRRGGFGLFYRERFSEVLATLLSHHGAATLASVPGFSVGPGGLLLEIPSDGALVPYRDPQGRITALEVFNLKDPGSHYLLGGEPGGRDASLGGTNHLWTAGEPDAIEAIADDLLEAMRAASAGVRCGGLQAPGACAPPAGEPTLPELSGADLKGRRLLYAPGLGEPDRSRAAAPVSARTLIANPGGEPVVLGTPPESYARGLGTFLLSVDPDDRRAAFDRLFGPQHSTALPPDHEEHPDNHGQGGEDAGDDAAGRPGNTPGASEEQAGGEAPAAAPAPRHAAFYAEMAKRPRRPSPMPELTSAETERGIKAAAGALLVLLPLLTLTLAPLVRALHALAALPASVARGAPSPEASQVLKDPIGSLAALVGPALAPVFAPLEGALYYLAGALSSFPVVVLLSLGLCALVGRRVAGAHRLFRFERILMLEGRIKEKVRDLPPKKKLRRRRARSATQTQGVQQ